MNQTKYRIIKDNFGHFVIERELGYRSNKWTWIGACQYFNDAVALVATKQSIYSTEGICKKLGSTPTTLTTL